MVLVPSSTTIEGSDRRISTKKRLLITTFLGIGLLIVPIILLFVDPILFVTDYNLRLDKGTMLHDLLLAKFEGPKLHVYIFNVTNAEDFMSGRDEKVKLEEIGPFVFHEYRTNDDLEINEEPGIMKYTPKLKTEFVLEESIGRLEDTYLTVPNLPLLAGCALMSQYPYFMRQIFNVIVANTHSKAFVKISAYDQLWGYPDPLVNLANTVVPGLIYFKTVGLLERLYDFDADYRLEIGTRNSDKFSVKKVTRLPLKKKDSKAVNENTQAYNDTYEGAAFPPNMTPGTPINIYRHSVCKTFKFQHVGSRSMFYGGEAFVYHVHNTTFNDHQQCDSKGWCPGGLQNLAPCYFGIPFVISKGHFLDADPRLLNHTEGLKSDRKLHDIEFTIEPKIGVTITGFMSLQLSLFLADVGFNPEAKRLKDTVLPLSHITVKPPRMLKEVRSALRFIFIQGPSIVLATQVLCTILGLGLLAWSARMMYSNWMARSGTRIVLDTRYGGFSKAHRPLLFK